MQDGEERKKGGREANDPVSPTSFSRSSEHKNAFENILEEEGRVRSTPM